MECITKSAEETKALGKKTAASLTKGGVILLYGDLGSGKTTFVQGFAEKLGVAGRIVSPTFIMMRTYDINIGCIKRLYHVDLYRLEDDVESELNNLGLMDALADPEAVILVEWAERAKDLFSNKLMSIRFAHGDESTRKIEIEYEL